MINAMKVAKYWSYDLRVHVSLKIFSISRFRAKYTSKAVLTASVGSTLRSTRYTPHGPPARPPRRRRQETHRNVAGALDSLIF